MEDVMYRKCLTGFLLAGAALFAAELCVGELRFNRVASEQAFQMHFMDESMEEDQHSFWKMIESVSSGQRIVDYEVLEREKVYELSERDYDALLRIVEAEAGGEDQNGKLLVANVVLNRVDNERFPDTVWEVVMQKEQGVAQFSPTVDGRYQKVVVSEDTVEAVERALYGENISKGALFFCARQRADSDKMKWFDEHLTRLFAYGNHEFFS